MPKVHLYIERQSELVICKLVNQDRWFFTACYEGVKELLGFDFPKGAKFEFDLEASNITKEAK
jgi:hypothetical protein